MIFSSVFSLSVLLSVAASQEGQPWLFINPPPNANIKIPTSRESAIQARRILHLTPLATLSTTFPSSKSPQSEWEASTSENRPTDLGGISIGLMDYIADCESSGDPTILAISIATTFKNAAAGSNVSLSLQWTPPYPPSSRIGGYKEPVPYSAANLPRFALLGYLENIPKSEVESLALGECFTKTHRDAKYWLPGNSIHHSEWVRLVVQKIYWVGGFGDRAYIGWIPVEEWQSVTREEWESIKLPGEKKGWKEWAVESLGQWEL
ncbi:pyridoxamine 5'-phosphate oxidase-domain-containing protein [Bisporella sp. PMI_857]|nr:pyridoxamine 5'-phosphate oxidase-domain-containing protein [Bisporella sp. PMI_857]